MAITLANAFAERGVRTDLVTARYKGPYRGTVEDAVRVVDLEASRTLTSLPALVRYLVGERPYALLSTLMYANVVAAGAHWGARSDARFVATEVSLISDPHRDSESSVGRLMRWEAMWAYGRADAVVGVSNEVVEDLVDALGVSKRKARTIHNPMPLDRIRALAGEPVDGLEKGPPIVLGVGSLTREKDFPTLLRAFVRVRERRNARLVILGEGEQRQQLESLAHELKIEDAVFLPGFVENPFAWMKAASVFVLTSKWEGFGNVLVEAMACGTPVVSTDCPGGPREILEGGKWGALVPVGNEEALGDSIVATLDDPPVEAAELVERAGDFAAEEIATEYLEVLGIEVL